MLAEGVECARGTVECASKRCGNVLAEGLEFASGRCGMC